MKLDEVLKVEELYNDEETFEAVMRHEPSTTDT